MIYDISQPLFSCAVYPGDPAPEKRTLSALEKGESCNLTWFSMCAHNGTHVDAPLHFLAGGAGIASLGLAPFVGEAWVASCAGALTREEAERIVSAAAAPRLLLKGNAVVSAEAAAVFAGAGLQLIGVESQSFGPEEAPAEVHRILLGAGLVLLEGVRLAEVPEGPCFLSAAPLNLGEADGAPTRAYLIR
ncbi:MAG: cyclase family protein [bacterium]